MVTLPNSARPLSRRPRGAVALLAAFLVVVLLGMVAFAIDVGYIAYAQAELQRSADAAALAAAAQLPDEGLAIDAAIASSQENETNVTPLILESDVTCGYWDRDSAAFDLPPVGKSPSAVRVVVRRTAAGGNPLRLFFAHLLGCSMADVTASATASKDGGLCGAFIGIESVIASGDVSTDSFDSQLAPYDAATARDHGGLCSDGPVTLNGSDYIRGDVRGGRDADVNINGSSTVTGNVGHRVKPLNLPGVDATTAALYNDNALITATTSSGGKGKSGKAESGNGKSGKGDAGTFSPLDSQGNFRLDGTTTYNLPPGTYYFHDMDLAGQSVLNITGPTVIYLTGDLKRAGGTVVNNNTQIAANLKIYSTGGSIDITSDNNFYGYIYAPHSQVTVGGTADFFGAIVGLTLKIQGDAQAHYDESLRLEEVELPTRVTLVE
jgi:Flp pilus assembly protein TadG